MFRDKGVTLMKGDWTNRAPAITKALAEFGRAGVPLYVVYNGTHSGDWIAARNVPQLMNETRKLQGLTSDAFIVEFTNDMMELAQASIATGNPIVF